MQNVASKDYDLGSGTSVIVSAEIDLNRRKTRTNLVNTFGADTRKMIEDQLIKVGKTDHLGFRRQFLYAGPLFVGSILSFVDNDERVSLRNAIRDALSTREQICRQRREQVKA